MTSASLDDLRRLGVEQGWTFLAECPLCGSTAIAPLGLARDSFGICRCPECTIVFLNPRRGSTWPRYRESSMPHGFFARQIEFGLLSSEFEPDVRRITARYARIVTLVDQAPTGTVVEVGCGLGLLAFALRARSREVRGIELSEAHADAARRVFGLDVTVWDLFSAPPLADRSSVVVLNSVLDHQEAPVEFLRLVREKILRPDGEVVVASPNLRSTEFLLSGLDWPLFTIDRLWYFTDDSLAEVARRAGYRIAGSHWPTRRSVDDAAGLTGIYVHELLGLDVNVSGGIGLRLAPTGE